MHNCKHTHAHQHKHIHTQCELKKEPDLMLMLWITVWFCPRVQVQVSLWTNNCTNQWLDKPQIWEDICTCSTQAFHTNHPDVIYILSRHNYSWGLLWCQNVVVARVLVLFSFLCLSECMSAWICVRVSEYMHAYICGCVCAWVSKPARQSVSPSVRR